MMAPALEEVVVDEQIWRAWIQKGRKRETNTVRKMKMVGGIVLILLAFGVAFYRLGTT